MNWYIRGTSYIHYIHCLQCVTSVMEIYAVILIAIGVINMHEVACLCDNLFTAGGYNCPLPIHTSVLFPILEYLISIVMWSNNINNSATKYNLFFCFGKPICPMINTIAVTEKLVVINCLWKTLFINWQFRCSTFHLRLCMYWCKSKEQLWQQVRFL